MHLANLVAGVRLIADTTYDETWLKDLFSKSNDTFSNAQQAVTETGTSLYSLLMVIAAVFMVLALIVAGITLAMSKSGRASEETKGWILRICLGSMIVFGSLFIMGILMKLGTGLNSSNTTSGGT